MVITEFGCASFEGAEEKGPVGHEIVDFTGPLPVVRGSQTRNEQVQADQLIELLDIYAASGVEGVFVYELIEPAYPYSPDPRHDLDMAGYGIVKVIGDGQGGYCWEPKTAFHAVAARYRR